MEQCKFHENQYSSIEDMGQNFYQVALLGNFYYHLFNCSTLHYAKNRKIIFKLVKLIFRKGFLT